MLMRHDVIILPLVAIVSRSQLNIFLDERLYVNMLRRQRRPK